MLSTQVAGGNKDSTCRTLNSSESADVDRNRSPLMNLLSPEQTLYGTVQNQLENLVIDQNENPLMNDVVLNTLFKYVKSKDLMRCRLVSMKWCRITLPFVRQKCVVNLCKCGFCQPKRSKRNINSFVKLIESNTLGIPFVKFHSSILGNPDDYSNTFKRVLDVMGSDVQGLNLCSINPESMAEVLRKVPNLETLTIPYRITENSSTGMVYKLFPEQADRNCKLLRLSSLQIVEYCYGVPISSLCPTFFEELFGVAENISNIFFKHFGVHDNLDVISVLRVIEAFGRESCIKSLTFPGLNTDHVEILTRMIKKNNGLRLQKLKISRRYFEIRWDENSTDWYPLISLLKNELVELTTGPYQDLCKYIDKNDNDQFELRFPRMVKLKVLQLTLLTPTTTIISLENDSFKNTFPVLEKLSLTNEILNLNELFIGNNSCPRMKSLHLGRDTTLELETFNRIILICPALNSFQLEIAQDVVEIVRKIWTEMTFLQELDLKIKRQFGISIDSLLTGIPDAQCQTIDHHEKDWHSLNRFSRKERNFKIMTLVDQIRVDVSVANLKNLRKFRLCLSYGGEQDCISNVAGYLGLYSLKCLKHIYLDHCKMSPDLCKLMIVDMKLETWRFQHRYTVDSDLCWCKKRDVIPKKQPKMSGFY